MNPVRSFISILLLAATQAALADSFAIDATVAAVTISPGAAERRYIRLPGLDVDVSVNASCADGSAPAVTLSSADTREQLDDASTPHRFSIPASQIAPLWAEDFCIVDNGLEQALRLTKRAFISIVGSLRCGNGENSSLTSRTAVVDVEVGCDRGLLEAAQEPLGSSDSARNSRVRSQD